MKISDKINSNTIVLPLKSDCIHDVLQELLDHCIKLDYLTSSVKLISSLDEKEKIISSASGRGVAYHYNTSIEVDDVIAILGIAPRGIDYEAPDGMLCNFILLILEASITLIAPFMFVLTHSNGLYSAVGTIFVAAA